MGAKYFCAKNAYHLHCSSGLNLGLNPEMNHFMVTLSGDSNRNFEAEAGLAWNSNTFPPFRRENLGVGVWGG
jgi:hypothetical protein